MNTLFGKRLVKVTIGHFAMIFLVFIVSGWRYYFRHDKEINVPIEFYVQVDTGPVKNIEKEAEKAVEEKEKEKPEEKEIIDPEKIKKPSKPKDKVKKPPKPKGNKTAILPGPVKKSPLSAKEIERLLALGATPDANRTIVPDEETLYKEIIRRRFYDAWTQPSGEEAGRSVAEGAIWFNIDGTVKRAELTQPSGIPSMDASVTFALNSVKEVPGLTVDFLKAYPRITIAFKIGEE